MEWVRWCCLQLRAFGDRGTHRSINIRCIDFIGIAIIRVAEGVDTVPARSAPVVKERLCFDYPLSRMHGGQWLFQRWTLGRAFVSRPAFSRLQLLQDCKHFDLNELSNQSWMLMTASEEALNQRTANGTYSTYLLFAYSFIYSLTYLHPFLTSYSRCDDLMTSLQAKGKQTKQPVNCSPTCRIGWHRCY
jgi:hypothetical protein